MNYNFYYDESYHDPAISQKSGVQNIERDNYSEFFTVCIVGVDSNKINEFNSDYLRIEDK